ncbi:hypothetical protein ACLOJK_019145, partial [Asimina triloba]
IRFGNPIRSCCLLDVDCRGHVGLPSEDPAAADGVASSSDLGFAGMKTVLMDAC